MFHVPELYRLREGPMGSNPSYGNNGVFLFPPSKKNGRWLSVIASDGMGWEHVSVHAEKDGKPYTPFWDEMQELKLIFWDSSDVVIQYHPAESEYVNNHPNVLHMWRPTNATIPTPPSILVGVKNG